MKKYSKKAMKIGIAVAIVMVTATLVGATLLSFFGEVETTMNVQQSVTIDGNNWDTPVTHNILDAYGGCCYCFEHTISNNGCEPIMLGWDHWGVPDIEGISVKMVQRCYLEHLEVDVLDGIADDSFDVYVDDVLVYSYSNGEPVNDPEVWHVHNVDLTGFMIPCYGTHTVKIDATGPAWQHHGTYGQLGVNEISLYCGCSCDPVLCDYVDIGDPISESGHNLVSWGCIEPLTSGGNWGGIDDCRVTWQPQGSTWATVELTCDFCECDCDKEPVVEPFELLPGESISFCLCYKLDMLLMPGDYIIHSQLVPVVD